MRLRARTWPARQTMMLSSETWYFLLLPNAVLIAVALIRRTSAWRHAAAFSFGHLLFGILIGYWDVYVLNEMDEKFRRAPVVAFEIRLVGEGAFSAFGGVLLVAGLAVGRRMASRKSLAMNLLSVSLFAGAVDAIGGRILYAMLRHGDAYTPAAWIWTCCFPLAYAVTILAFPRTKTG